MIGFCWRDNVAIADIELLGFDLGLIGNHVAFVLQDQRYLGIELLARNGVALGEILVAFEIQLGILQQRLVTLQRALRLRQRQLIGPRIDLRQQIALVDVLALGEGDAHQLAADLRDDGHGGERRHGAQRVQRDVDIAPGQGRDRNRDGGRGLAGRPRGSLMPRQQPGPDSDQHNQGDDNP